MVCINKCQELLILTIVIVLNYSSMRCLYLANPEDKKVIKLVQYDEIATDATKQKYFYVFLISVIHKY